MGPYRHGEPPPRLTTEDVRQWLRHHVTKPVPSRWRRWLGEPASFRYELDAPVPWQNDFFDAHCLFTVRAREPGLLPLPRWEGTRQESWGIFAVGPDGLELLLPGGSLTRLLRAEGRPLDQGSVLFIVQLVCALELGEEIEHHTVVPPTLARHRSEQSPWGCYEVDGETLMWLGHHELEPPSIEPKDPMLGGGWDVRFSTVVQRNSQPVELGTEQVTTWPDFTFFRHARRVVASSPNRFISLGTRLAVISNPGPVDEPDHDE